LIVDTSALAAVALGETGWRDLVDALSSEPPVIPASVLTELQLALASRGVDVVAGAAEIVEKLTARGAQIASFEYRHADLTALARDSYGKGNGRGGKLNFGDLLVYAIAKDLRQPLLCTGRDFAATDLEIHPASRLDL